MRRAVLPGDGEDDIEEGSQIVTISFGISGFFYMLGGFLGDFIGVYPTMLIACLLIIIINLIVLRYSENFRKLKI